MSKNRYFSLILSIIMLLQIIAPLPAQAMTLGQSGTVQKSEGQVIDGKSEIFAFKNPKRSSLSWFRRASQPLFGARDASTTKTETLKITTTATGLDEGDQPFDWAAFGQNKKFRAWIEVAYVEDKKPGEEFATKRHKVSKDFDISAEGDINATATLDASKTVDYYFLKTEYDTDDAAFKINAVLEYAGSLSPQKTNNLEFNVDIHQIVSTKITYNLIDEYGKAIDLTDTKEEKPADTDLENLGKIGNVTTFNLKKEGTEILWQEQKLDEWNLMDSSLAMSLTKNEIKSNDIDYKLSSTYDVINGGKVTIQRQKDAVTPKDPQNPGDIPEGYARLNLSADAKAGGPTGTFTKDDTTDNRRVVDVRAGKPYTTAQAEVDKVTKPFPLTSEKKVDTGKTFDKWTPALSKLGTAVAKETKNLNASYKSSDVEIIPYLPGEEVPTKDKDGLPIPTDYVTVTFKSESATKGKVKIGDKEGETVLAKVKPGIDLSKKAEITTVPAENYGFTEWKPVLGKAAADQTYTAHFVKSGDKINEGDPIPKGWLKVTVSQDKSIVDNTVEKAIYTVKSGDKLGKDKFVDLKGKAKDGYKDPAWYVGSEKLEKPYEKPITTSTDFLASATEEIANKFKTNPLKAEDITAYKGDKIEGKFWNKGVTTQREDAVLERLIESATVTDITATKRTTDKAGTFPGTLKVTFEDGSSLEVQNQRLIVIDTKVDIDYDKDSKKDANAPRHKDEVVKGKIKSEETLKGAKVEILDKDNNVIGITLANADGSFIAGTRELQAGETIKVRVTLPKADKPSPAVKKVVGLNPDELNSILPTADKLFENLKGKPGVSKAKLDILDEAIKAGKALIDENTKKPAASVTVDDKGQKSLDEAFANIKTAMEDLMENKIPMINGPDHKEIFVGGEIDLDKDIQVVDDNIKKQDDGKDYSYKIYDASGTEVQKAAMVAKDGVYRVVYSAEDAQGVKASHTMTVIVKKTVVEVPGEFPEKTPEGYVKVEFKSGEHAGLNGVSKFLVKKDAPKSEVKEPTIIPKEGYKVAEPKWSKEIPATFATDFETTAQVLAKATTDKPADKDMDKYATLTFEAGDHGKFEKGAKTTIYVLKNEEVKFNAPKIEANDGFTFAKWDPEIQKSYSEDQTHTAKYTSNKNVSDTKVEGFQEVKFTTDSNGKFVNETSETEKSVWVRPNTLVDLTDKQPTVTVTNDKKAYTGWNHKLIAEFAKAETATEIKAVYKDIVVTDNPNDTNYAEVKFVAGNHGTFDKKDEKTTFWVLKGKDVTADFKAPTVTAKAGYTFKAWDPEIQKSYDKDQTHTATYTTNNDVSETEVEGFNKVTFKAGEHGTLTEKSVWVKPDTLVDLTDKAPAVTANKGYSHKGWKPGLVGKFANGSEIVAQYITDIDGNGKEDSTETTPTPSILSARNVKDGDNVETKVLVKGKPGATITIKSEDGQTVLGTGTVGDNGQVEIKLNPKQDAGKKVQAIAKLGEMKPSDPAESIVFDDLNNDGKPDGQGKVDFKNIVDMRIASDPKTMKYALTSEAGSKDLDLSGLTVYVKDKNGNSGIYQYGAEANKVNNIVFEELKDNANFKLELVDGQNQATAINADTKLTKANDANKIKVTVMNGQTPTDKADTTGPLNVFVDANGNGIDDDKEKIDLTKIKDIKVINQPELNYPITEKDGKTKLDLTKMVVEVSDGVTKAKFTAKELLEAKIGEGNEAKAAFKLSLVDGENEKAKITDLTGTELTTANDQNKVKIALADKETVNDKTAALEVFEDLDKDGKRDTKQTPAPTELKALNKKDDKFTTITGKAQKGDTIKVYGEDGKEITTEPGTVTVGEDGTFTIKVADNGKALPENTKIFVTAQAKDKEESPRTPVVVKADKDGNGIADEDEKSAKAEDVKALNQNKVDPQTGKVTSEPKDTTTVTGKAKPGTTVKILDENGKDITPQAGVVVDPNTGEFTAEVTKQNEGKKVKVVVTEPGKQDSDPVEKTVVRDSDNDGEDDTKAGRTERPAALASNIGKTPTFTTIKGKTEKGATITVNVKVNGEEKPVTVENLKVNDDGTYTLEAKYDNKPLENGAEILVYATNAPKTISKPQTTTVFNDFNKDGKPDGGKVDLTDVKDIQVIAPNKMSYTEGDKLNGTGLKAVVRDNKGGIEIFDYDNDSGKFKNADNEVVADITATVNGKAIKDFPLTEKEHDGKAIDVKVGQTKASTNQKLEVKQLQTPTPSIEFAANQNTVGSTGQATETAKQKTTVKFTVKNKPTTVYVKYTDNGVAKEETFEIGANDELTKTVDLQVKLPVGAEVQVLAKDADKTLSKAATATVVRDANNDGTADDKTKLKPAIIADIKAGAKEIVVTAPEGATELVISETDKNGKTPDGSKTITVKKDSDGNWKIGDTSVTVDGDKLTIPKGDFKLEEYNVIKVEAKGDPDTTEPSTITKTVGEAADETAPDKPVVDKPIDGDKDIKVKTPTEKDAKTITVEVEVKGKPGEDPTKKTVVVEKDDKGNWKVGNTPVKEENGKLVIPVDPAVKTGDKVTVKVADASGNDSKPDSQTVVERQQLPVPTIDTIKTGGKTVSGKAEKAATVDIYKKNAEGKYEPLAKDVGVSPDGSYTYNNADGFKDGDVIRVVAKKTGMTSSNNEVTVGVDTSALDKAIQNGKDALDPEKGGKNNGTPEDKALEDAIKKGEEEKNKKPPKQEDVDKAKEAIEKAIEDKKKADEARDKLQEKINEANDKKNDPDYDSKPDYAKNELAESAKDGQDVHDNKDKTKDEVDKAIEKIQEKLDQYNKQQIGANIRKVTSNDKTVVVAVTAPNAKVEVFKIVLNKKTWKNDYIPLGEKTDITNLLVVSLEEQLPKGTKLLIKVTHPSYLSYENTVTVE